MTDSTLPQTPLAPRRFAALRRLYRALYDHFADLQTKRTLSALPDHLLDDAGIVRGAIDPLAPGNTGQDAATRLEIAEMRSRRL
ncbi:MAG: DUF1127 domain-containing protein [Pseudomonadota bacterium]